MTSRRDLLRFFTATAGCAVLSACVQISKSPADRAAGEGRFGFPQGVASGDPQPDGFVLWTRVEGAADDVDLIVEVSDDAGFETVLRRDLAVASAQFFHTVRVLVTDLPADQFYFYRFIAPDGSKSRTGRSRTAPAGNSNSPATVAIFSCQNYEQGYFTSYRALMQADARAKPDRKIDFVLHVGDFVYENVREEGTQGWHDLNWSDPRLVNADGSLRRVGPYPSGGQDGAFGYRGPKTLEDYRHLYLTYLGDPDLQDIRATYPMIQTWDDHEVYNDVWQSFTGDHSITELKLAGNQAWFEFIPAALSSGGGDPEHHAHEFTGAEVRPASITNIGEDFLVQDQANLDAIGSLAIYRTIRWGELFELFLVDGRSYRGPSPSLPEFSQARRKSGAFNTVPSGLISEIDAGRVAHDGQPSPSLTYLGLEFPNPRLDQPANSMLGGRQREWLLRGLSTCQAKWKLLGLNVGLMRHGFDDSFAKTGNKNGLYWLDGWDGYPGERTSITSELKARGIDNVVSLTGDRHMHMAGYIYADFDSAQLDAVAVEFCGAAVSAPNRLAIMAGITRAFPDYAPYFFHTGVPERGENLIRPSMDQLMLNGHASAGLQSAGAPVEEIASAADPEINPHLQYADSDSFGFMVAHVRDRDIELRHITVEEPVRMIAQGDNVPTLRAVAFRVDVQRPGQAPKMTLVRAVGSDTRLKLRSPS